MRATTTILALALAASLQPAVAAVAPVELHFQDITTAVDPDGLVELGNRYSSSGVLFSGAAWGVVSGTSNCGGIVKFVPHVGSGGASDCGALELWGDPRGGNTDPSPSITLSFADGFISGSSLYYSALLGSTITALDAAGGTLGRWLLDGKECTATPGARFCNWDQLVLDFGGSNIARSLVISGTDEALLIDDIKLVRADTAPGTGGELPEPGSMALAFGALGALGWTRKRAAR